LLYDIKALVKSALNLVKVRQKTAIIILAVQQNISHQTIILKLKEIFFYKEKRHSANVRLSKPSEEEKLEIFFITVYS